MKKILSLIAFAMTFGMTSCSDDTSNHDGDYPSLSKNPIVGMWYVEADNEEINYDESGKYYDRYSNVELSGETEGRYEFDQANMKLTYRYTYLGQNMQDDWTVKNLSEFGFKLSSAIAPGRELGKIVEQYKLSVGETVKLRFGSDRADVKIRSYSSKNEYLAFVSSDGTITAMGEKGTTYIKINTNVGNVWAKITVGDDNKDLWCDYVSVIGANYNTMRQYFGRLGEPLSDGIDYYKYIPYVHHYIESVNIQINAEEDCVTTIQLFIKDGVSPIEIKSYLKSRYYEQEDFDFYTTQSDLEKSRAIVTYDQNNRCVTFFETQHILHLDLWHDFTKMFGCDKTAVKTAMDKYGYSFLMSNNSYSKDGSDYYYITDNNYVQMIGFVFNPDKLVSEFWLYMDTKSDPNDIYGYLCAKYTEKESESSQYALVFYNDDKSIKVTFDLKAAAVIYTKLTMKQHEANNEILGNYYEALGMTHDQILAQYGNPYSDDGGKMFYIVGTDYVNLAAFYMNEETNKCRLAAVTINESVPHSTIIDYLNSKYAVFANGTSEDGSQYAWTNGPSVAESTMGIIYVPANNIVTYQSLGSAANAKARNTIEIDNKFVEQVGIKTSAFLKGVNKMKENITTHKVQRLKGILENLKK